MMHDVRIGVLTRYGPTRHVGGVETFNDCLQRALGPLEIFADDPPESSPSLTELSRIGLEQPVGAIRAAKELLRRHREEPFDVIVSNGVYGWPLTLARPRVPLVQVYHFTMAGLARHALTLPGDRLTTGRVTALFDRIAGIGKHVIAVSHRVLGEVRSFYGLDGQFIPNAVDTNLFRPMNRTAAREALGLPQELAIGIFVGRPDPTKGYDILLRVAQRMPEVMFLEVGGGGTTTKNLRALGRVPHTEMPKWYAAADFFFLPSRYEGFSLSLLEALSCNLPAVVSEAAWPFPEGPAECGVVASGERDDEFVAGIRTVLRNRQEYSPRRFILPRYDLTLFERSWTGLIGSLLNGAA